MVKKKGSLKDDFVRRAGESSLYPTYKETRGQNESYSIRDNVLCQVKSRAARRVQRKEPGSAFRSSQPWLVLRAYTHRNQGH